MVSSTPFFRSIRQNGRHAVGALLATILTLVSVAANAEGITTRYAKVESSDEGYRVDAEFDIQFSPGLEEAVNRGVPLYFVVDFQLTKPRWYWFDEKPVQASQAYKITYTPLLRQYRLSSGSAYQNFTRFGDVVRALSRVRGWTVADKGALRRDVGLQASIRMRLDTTQLPKPFQLNAVASRDWDLASDWYRWTANP